MSPFAFLKSFILFFEELISKRYVIGQLIQRDLQDRYVGSYLGFLWPFLQQLFMVVIMSFVLQNGLRVTPILNIPFVVWIIPAQAMWMFFSEAMSTSINVYVTYAYLVKKISFKVAILPLVKILSAFVNHCLFLVVVCLFVLTAGMYPDWYWLQVLYYLVAAFFLVLGLAWLLASLAVFIRDVGQVVTIVLNFAMWVTPLFWDINNLQGPFRLLVWLNPVSYLTEGYRRSFLYHQPFWEDPLWTAYYWGVVLVFLVLGVIVFRKLRPSFADVL